MDNEMPEDQAVPSTSAGKTLSWLYPPPVDRRLNVEKQGSLHHEPELTQKLHRKAKIATGHITGIAKMIEDEKYCIDILKQIAAVQGTLTAIARDLAHSHIIHCVRSSIDEGSGVKAVEELLQTLKYLQRA